jgi:hypothetical protein
MATHNSKYCEVVGICRKCEKSISFYGTNATEANRAGDRAGWIHDDCEKVEK